MRLRDLELKARSILTKARVDSPGLCARLLAAHAAGLDKVTYVLAWDKELAPDQEQLFWDYTRRRAAGEPLAYILGYKEFYGIDFIINSATLTPRPETEMLVDLALSLFPENKNIRFADLGCGSGCIGLTLSHLRNGWYGILIDNSACALEVCNANRNNLNCVAEVMRADIFNPPLAANSLNLVVSNPPYIAAAEKDQVMVETIMHEPHSALFSPCNGMAHIGAMIECASHCLAPGGHVLFEHGAAQAEAARDMLLCAGFVNLHQEKDLAGLPRCAMAQKPQKN